MSRRRPPSSADQPAAGPPPLDARDRRPVLGQLQTPVVEGAHTTFLHRGEAEEVSVRHRVVGLPDPLPMRRLPDTDLWYVVAQLPRTIADRVPARGVHRRPPGSVQRSAQPGRRTARSAPARSATPPATRRRTGRNLTTEAGRRARRAHHPQPGPAARHSATGVPARPVPADQPVPTADRPRRHRLPELLVDEDGAGQPDPPDGRRRDWSLCSSSRATGWSSTPTTPPMPGTSRPSCAVPGGETAAGGQPAGRCLMGSSFGGVASLSTAVRNPGFYGSLLLQSASMVFTDIGMDHGGGRCSTRWSGS